MVGRKCDTDLHRDEFVPPLANPTMGGDARAYSLVQDAEKLLVRRKYEAAEVQAREALERIAHHLADADVRQSLGDRAAAVLLQALYETDRFSSARPCLVKTFGCLEDSPPHALLLWLSLGLDTAERDQVHHVTLSLLRDPSIPRRSGWTRRQFLALVHLYVIEILLPALKDPSEVIFWLDRQRFLPLDPRERRYLEEEVRACARLGTQTNGAQGQNQPKLFPSISLSDPKSPHETVPQDALYNDDGEASETGIFSGYAGFVGGADLGLSPVASRTAHRPSSDLPTVNSRAAGTGTGASEGASAMEKNSLARGTSPEDEELELDWLGKWQSLAFTGAATASSKVSKWMTIWLSSSSKSSPSTSHPFKEKPETGVGEEFGGTSSRSERQQTAPMNPSGSWQNNTSMVGLVGVAAMLTVAGLFSLAAYQERDFVKGATIKVARGVTRSLMDLSSMATSVSLN